MADPKIRIIKPKKTWGLDDLREIWDYRELLYFFGWRDIKVRYKQTIVGIGWAVFQPFMTMVVFTVVFGKLAKLPSDGIPYPVFVYSGLLFWQFFSSSLGSASNTLISNASLVTKVYFPRLILPVADSVTNLVDFAVAGVILIGLMIFYGYIPHLAGFLLLPVLLFIAFASAIGGGLFLASINVKYRDVRYVLPYFIQMLLFITPVIYPSSIAGKYTWLLNLNPMTGVISNARAALLGTSPINWALLGISLGISLALLAIGIITFNKTERFFADIV
jgi:lipopolysaccharide transport system permease protein